MSAEVTLEGSLEIREYGRSKRVVRLVTCPFCGYAFDDHEPRWKHFLEYHDPEEGALGTIEGHRTDEKDRTREESSCSDRVTDGERSLEGFVRTACLYDPAPGTRTMIGQAVLGLGEGPAGESRPSKESGGRSQ